MADFVVVVVAAALAVPPVPTDRNASNVPLSAPTVGFQIYRDATACEAAVTHMVARPGTRLVCVPVEPRELDTAAAF